MTALLSFFGHFLQQCLEGNLLLPLQAEMLADLALADDTIGIADEFEDLLLAGQSLKLVLWAFGHLPRHMGAGLVAVDR